MTLDEIRQALRSLGFKRQNEQANFEQWVRRNRGTETVNLYPSGHLLSGLHYHWITQESEFPTLVEMLKKGPTP